MREEYGHVPKPGEPLQDIWELNPKSLRQFEKGKSLPRSNLTSWDVTSGAVSRALGIKCGDIMLNPTRQKNKLCEGYSMPYPFLDIH